MFQRDKPPFLFYLLACWGRIFMLLSRFFNIMTGQKRDVTEITLLWWVSSQ